MCLGNSTVCYDEYSYARTHDSKGHSMSSSYTSNSGSITVRDGRRARLGKLALVVITMISALAIPSIALASNVAQPERYCTDVLVGIKSYTRSTTKHFAHHNPPGTYQVGDTFENGSTWKVRSTVSNHYWLDDSANKGSHINIAALSDFSWGYNYCTPYA